MNSSATILYGGKMVETIQVFVRNKQLIVGHFQTVEFTSPGHECTAKPVTAPILEQVFPETHEQAIKIAEKVAKEKGMKLKICNLSSSMGRIEALFKGVKTTPTIIVKNQKIYGEITEKKVLSLLE
jgi:deoxycytidylate deaminase